LRKTKNEIENALQDKIKKFEKEAKDQKSLAESRLKEK